ncbi:TPA: bacteriocin immunity protein [Vibrio parahaemolyticus]|nr:bacteriocin immunity protein [Vibrio parahaemolyticus]
MKNSLCDYKESEFLAILIESEAADYDSSQLDELVLFFNEAVEHPDGSDLLMYPTVCGIDDNPQAIISEIKRWYQSQGLPCFKE